MMLVELRKVIPSFLTRVDRPDRGGEWSEYFARRAEEMAVLSERLFPNDADDAPVDLESSVRLTQYDPHGEDRVLESILYGYVDRSDEATRRRIARMTAEGAGDACMATYVPVIARCNSTAPAWAGVRAHRVPLRHRLGLRRLP